MDTTETYDFETALRVDESGFLARLAALPHSYDGPDGLREEPYGLMAYGEAASVPGVFRAWVDAPLVLSGTQFFFVGGFDYGDAAPLKVNTELVGAEVVVLGHGLHAPDLPVAPDSLSFYTYASYLAYATGHGEALTAANEVMADLVNLVRPEIETGQNPAKTLAWQLWNRVPLLVAGRQQSGLVSLVQRVFARVGKSLAFTAGEHPLEVLAGALEARHQFGDDMVALVLGEEDEEAALAVELLETRVAQVERLSLPFGGIGAGLKDSGAEAIVLWYLSTWVAAYLSLLHKLEPLDTEVYNALRGAAPLKDEGELN